MERVTLEEANYHAKRAHNLLHDMRAAEINFSKQADDPVERVRLMALGAFTQFNSSMEWTQKVACAHAATAQAICMVLERLDDQCDLGNGESD